MARTPLNLPTRGDVPASGRPVGIQQHYMLSVCGKTNGLLEKSRDVEPGHLPLLGDVPGLQEVAAGRDEGAIFRGKGKGIQGLSIPAHPTRHDSRGHVPDRDLPTAPAAGQSGAIGAESQQFGFWCMYFSQTTLVHAIPHVHPPFPVGGGQKTTIRGDIGSDDRTSLSLQDATTLDRQIPGNNGPVIRSPTHQTRVPREDDFLTRRAEQFMLQDHWRVSRCREEQQHHGTDDDGCRTESESISRHYVPDISSCGAQVPDAARRRESFSRRERPVPRW